MGTAYIDVCITPVVRGVTLFQVECVAEVEYQTDGADLLDWHVSALKFQEFEGVWDARTHTWSRRASREARCPDDLFKPLLARIDQTALENTLMDLLAVTGETCSPIPAQPVVHDARVL